MPSFEPMSFHLETERLILRPWEDSDADELRALHAERGAGTQPMDSPTPLPQASRCCRSNEGRKATSSATAD
jgi:RimJ/RimL family protein N-acetyltransferase